jgi:hypothetical protein
VGIQERQAGANPSLCRGGGIGSEEAHTRISPIGGRRGPWRCEPSTPTARRLRGLGAIDSRCLQSVWVVSPTAVANAGERPQASKAS